LFEGRGKKGVCLAFETSGHEKHEIGTEPVLEAHGISVADMDWDKLETHHAEGSESPQFCLTTLLS
jgi:hypothetical protein